MTQSMAPRVLRFQSSETERPRAERSTARQRSTMISGSRMTRAATRQPASYLTLWFQWVTLAMLLAAVGIPGAKTFSAAAQVTSVVVTHSAWQIHVASQMAGEWESGQPDSAPGTAIRDAAPKALDHQAGVESRGGSETEPTEADSVDDTSAMVLAALGYPPIEDQKTHFTRYRAASFAGQTWVSACGPRGPPQA